MYWRFSGSWLKYVDFIVVDLFILEVAFGISVALRNGFKSPFGQGLYLEMSVVLILIAICVIFLTENYKGILHRGYFVEMKKTASQTAYIAACEGVFLFLTKQSEDFSRISFSISL